MIHKTTVGFVTQVFDEDTQRFIRQDFIAGDDVQYENPEGEAVTGVDSYLPFEMKQPQELNAIQKLNEIKAVAQANDDKCDQERLDLIFDILNTNC